VCVMALALPACLPVSRRQAQPCMRDLSKY
jgi:hypothetical protein